MKSIFELYEEEERRLEKEPYRTYKQIVSLATDAAAKRAGLVFSQKPEQVAKNIPGWKPFPDTNPSIEKLAAKYSLGILSNIDEDLLAGTLKHFNVKFDLIVTAEQVRSYKPSPAHFQEAARRIGKRNWLHVAASLYHDIAPTRELGIESVWVNRKRVQPDAHYSGTVKRQVRDLHELVGLLQQ